MAIDRRISASVPNVAPRISRVADDINRTLGSIAGALETAATVKDRKQQEQEAMERQGFDAELLDIMARYDSEDGFDFNGATAEITKRAGAKLTPMNRAMFLGSGKTRIQNRVLSQQTKDRALAERMDVMNAAGQAATMTQGIAEKYRQAWETTDPALRDGLAMQFHQDMFRELEPNLKGRISTEEGRATFYDRTLDTVLQADAELRGAEMAERLNLSAMAATDTFAEAMSVETPIDRIDAIGTDFRKAAKEMGLRRDQIADLTRKQTAALIASAVDRQDFAMLDRVVAYNGRLGEHDRLPPSELAQKVREATESVRSRWKKRIIEGVEQESKNAMNVGDLITLRDRLDGELADADPRYRAAISEQDRVSIDRILEARQGEIVSGMLSQITDALEASIKEADVSAAALADATGRVNWLGQEIVNAKAGKPNSITVKLLDGSERQIIDANTQRRYADQLEDARQRADERDRARKVVTEAISGGKSLGQYDPNGDEAKALAAMSARRINEGSTLGAEMVNVARTGLVPSEMIEQFGRTILPEGTGPNVLAQFDENFSALAALRGLRSPVARQIEQANPAVGYLMGMEQMGLGRDELARRVQEYGRERIEAAIGLVEEQIAQRGGVAPHRDTPYGQMLRAQAIDNVLRVMDPIEGSRLQKQQRELGKTQQTYRMDEIGTLVGQAITSAEQQVEAQVRTIPVYGREITLPRNGWTPQGDPEKGKFDRIEGANLDVQIDALVRAEGLHLTEPGMYRGRVHRRVVVRPDTLESVYNPETGRVSWRMRVDYVPATYDPGFRLWPGGTWVEQPFEARSLGWISLMQERE